MFKYCAVVDQIADQENLQAYFQDGECQGCHGLANCRQGY